MPVQDEASQIFRKYCPAARCIQEYGESVLLLLKELQYLPLAIVQAASYLNHYTHFSPAEYLKHFSDTRTAIRERLLSKPFNFHGRYAGIETVATTFSITYRQVQEQSPLASSLLKIMACIDHRGIPHELLARSGFDNEVILEEALRKLINLPLLTVRGVRAYDMHSLVYLSLQGFLSLHDMATTVERTAKALAEILPSGKDAKTWPVWKMYFPHAFSLARNVEEESTSTLSIYHPMFYYLMAIGNYKEAESQSRRAESTFIWARESFYLGQHGKTRMDI